MFNIHWNYKIKPFANTKWDFFLIKTQYQDDSWKIAIDRFQMVWDFLNKKEKLYPYMTMMQHILVQS
jgi:hypothetical protein